ncbi:MAG TPA: hypothetical protein VJB87_02430 [Candidatus Nanoarchaeia archaeon]|nr:hypothetical protein [Candidatus Nanoarchaeia archaeon]
MEYTIVHSKNTIRKEDRRKDFQKTSRIQRGIRRGISRWKSKVLQNTKRKLFSHRTKYPLPHYNIQLPTPRSKSHYCISVITLAKEVVPR